MSALSFFLENVEITRVDIYYKVIKALLAIKGHNTSSFVINWVELTQPDGVMVAETHSDIYNTWYVISL